MGLTIRTPTSVTATGTGSSATISTNGGVTFSQCSTLSINGVFTSAHMNYMIVMRSTYSAASTARTYLQFALRASGSDNQTSNAYDTQIVTAANANGAPNRFENVLGNFGWTSSQLREGTVLYLFGPNTTDWTVWRSLAMTSEGGAVMAEFGGLHQVSAAYDGLTIYNTGADRMAGAITVYGFNQ